MSVAASTAAAARWSGRTLDRLLAQPRSVIGTLIGLQIGATLVLALAVDHNGWVWFQGGDQIWLSTQGWLLGQLELPPTELGYLWSYALTPIMWVTGPTYVQALPPLVVLQVLVLGPVALLCIYDLASRIGGRLLGYWASFLWAIAPFASIPLFVDRYQERFGEQFLPQALGLTAMSDYPSMVLVLASAVFVVRSLDAARVTDAMLAGLLLGAATAVKPPNLLMGVGAALAYLVARRWRAGLAFGVAIVPSLLVLALWKERGLGGIPVLGLEETRRRHGSGDDRDFGRPRSVPRLRRRPLAPADGLHARVLLQRAGRPVGADRGSHRRSPRSAGRRSPRCSRDGLRRSSSSRGSRRAQTFRRTASGGSSCRPGPRTCSSSPRFLSSYRRWCAASEIGCARRRLPLSRSGGSQSLPYSPCSCPRRRSRCPRRSRAQRSR